jgi:hypothetical protein
VIPVTASPLTLPTPRRPAPDIPVGPRVWAVLQRLIAGVALCALLAGCSGSPGPTAVERSICKTVRAQLDALPKEEPLSPYAASESKQLLKGATSSQSTVVFVRISFVHELIRSNDPTFQRLGAALQRGVGTANPVRQLDARCSALGL